MEYLPYCSFRSASRTCRFMGCMLAPGRPCRYQTRLYNPVLSQGYASSVDRQFSGAWAALQVPELALPHCHDTGVRGPPSPCKHI